MSTVRLSRQDILNKNINAAFSLSWLSYFYLGLITIIVTFLILTLMIFIKKLRQKLQTRNNNCNSNTSRPSQSDDLEGRDTVTVSSSIEPQNNHYKTEDTKIKQNPEIVIDDVDISSNTRSDSSRDAIELQNEFEQVFKLSRERIHEQMSSMSPASSLFRVIKNPVYMSNRSKPVISIREIRSEDDDDDCSSSPKQNNELLENNNRETLVSNANQYNDDDEEEKRIQNQRQYLHDLIMGSINLNRQRPMFRIDDYLPDEIIADMGDCSSRGTVDSEEDSIGDTSPSTLSPKSSSSNSSKKTNSSNSHISSEVVSPVPNIVEEQIPTHVAESMDPGCSNLHKDISTFLENPDNNHLQSSAVTNRSIQPITISEMNEPIVVAPTDQSNPLTEDTAPATNMVFNETHRDGYYISSLLRHSASHIAAAGISLPPTAVASNQILPQTAASGDNHKTGSLAAFYDQENEDIDDDRNASLSWPVQPPTFNTENIEQYRPDRIRTSDPNIDDSLANVTTENQVTEPILNDNQHAIPKVNEEPTSHTLFDIQNNATSNPSDNDKPPITSEEIKNQAHTSNKVDNHQDQSINKESYNQNVQLNQPTNPPSIDNAHLSNINSSQGVILNDTVNFTHFELIEQLCNHVTTENNKQTSPSTSSSNGANNTKNNDFQETLRMFETKQSSNSGSSALKFGSNIS